MKHVLIGTTNAAKVGRFQALLHDYDVKFYTLRDLNITEEPSESGKTPVENAVLKAKCYGKYFDLVLCNDSGLYFDGLPTDDPRQPALNIRAPQGKRLDDEEMIEYYGKLIHVLGGKILAYYLDGIAVYNRGEIFTFIEPTESAKQSAFYMVDIPSPKRHAGWPLDSLSLNRNTMTYFVEHGSNQYDTEDENIILGEYRRHLTDFLISALGL